MLDHGDLGASRIEDVGEFTANRAAAPEIKRKSMYQLGIPVVVVIHQYLERFVVEKDQLRAENFVGKKTVDAQIFIAVDADIIDVPAGGCPAGFVEAFPQVGGVGIAAAHPDGDHGKDPFGLQGVHRGIHKGVEVLQVISVLMHRQLEYTVSSPES